MRQGLKRLKGRQGDSALKSWPPRYWPKFALSRLLRFPAANPFLFLFRTVFERSLGGGETGHWDAER